MSLEEAVGAQQAARGESVRRRNRELRAENARLEAELARLRDDAEQAHRLAVEGAVTAGDRGPELTLDIGKEHLRLGLVSDTHGGSHAEQLTALRHFYRYADEREVDAFVHGGDLTQGSDKMHLEQPYQVHVHGADQQAGYVALTYPRSERGAKTYAIAGNHDASFLKDGGTDVVRLVTKARPDVVYLGRDAHYFSIGALKMYLVHPRGGMPYAKSYRLQKIAESLPIGRQVNLMLMGHLHTYAVVQEHGMTAMLLPCFQGPYGWLATGGLHPTIGGIILDVWMTDDGSVGRLTHELVRYQARENDWDRDASHAVQRPWSDETI